MTNCSSIGCPHEAKWLMCLRVWASGVTKDRSVPLTIATQLQACDYHKQNPGITAPEFFTLESRNRLQAATARHRQSATRFQHRRVRLHSAELAGGPADAEGAGPADVHTEALTMIKLGSKVKDKVTGITGTATARLEHLFGDPQVFVEIADGSIRLTEWYYEQRLQPIDEKAVASVTTLAERSADA